MRRWIFPLLLLVAFALLVPRPLVHWLRRNRSPWNEITRGVEMRRFAAVEKGGAANVVAFRVAPSRVHVVTGRVAEAPEWRQKEGALVAVNGAFFDSQMRSLGLRIADGRRRVAWYRADGGVFVIRNGRPSLVAARDYSARRGTTQAIQCSPRLVVAGRLKTFKEQWARRTAIGIARDGRVVIAVADGAIAFKDWAKIWESPQGLNCRDALSLDGGGSTQLSVATPRAKLEIGGATAVPDAVVIR